MLEMVVFNGLHYSCILYYGLHKMPFLDNV